VESLSANRTAFDDQTDYKCPCLCGHLYWRLYPAVPELDWDIVALRKVRWIASAFPIQHFQQVWKLISPHPAVWVFVSFKKIVQEVSISIMLRLIVTFILNASISLLFGQVKDNSILVGSVVADSTTLFPSISKEIKPILRSKK